MADWRVRMLVVAVTAAWAGVACGSRTGDYLGPGHADGVGFGTGGVDGFGGASGGTVGGGGRTSGATATFGSVAATGSGVGATFGMGVSASGFSASGTTGPSSFGSGVGFFGITAVSGSGFGNSGTGVSTTGMTSGVGGASGSCCEASAGPGCEDPGVAACVCRTDPFCCNYLWDGFCAGEVESLGCGSCEVAVGGAGGGMQSAVSVVTGSVVTAGAVTTTGAVTATGVVTGSVSVVSASASGMGGASSTSTTGEGGSGGVAECIAQSRTKCEACLCGDCFHAYGDCVGDFGCPRILECIDATGCTGIDCYAPDTCQSVIDRFGGLMGASVAYVTELVECAADAGCPCQ